MGKGSGPLALGFSIYALPASEAKVPMPTDLPRIVKAARIMNARATNRTFFRPPLALARMAQMLRSGPDAWTNGPP